MNGFFNLILGVWNQDFLGISIGNVVISLIIIVSSLILRALIISRVFKFLENLAKETETEADDILLETLEKPIGNVPLALGLYLIIELLPLSGIADVFLTNSVKALIAYTIFSVLTKAIGPIFELLAIKSWVTAALSMWLSIDFPWWTHRHPAATVGTLHGLHPNVRDARHRFVRGTTYPCSAISCWLAVRPAANNPLAATILS